MRKNWQLLVVLAGIWLGIASIGKAQLIDQTWVNHHALIHLATGSGVDLFVHGPWITRSWRNTVAKRVAWSCVVGFSYELYQRYYEGPGNGWSYPMKYVWLDTGATCVGALATEGLITVVKKVL